MNDHLHQKRKKAKAGLVQHLAEALFWVEEDLTEDVKKIRRSQIILQMKENQKQKIQLIWKKLKLFN